MLENHTLWVRGAMAQKISISLDEKIVKLIDMDRGDVPRSRYIENVIKSAGFLLEALWLFSDEFDSISTWERWVSAHTSQPIGKPLHKHEGYLSISGGSMRFYTPDMDPLYVVKRDSITDISVGYDEFFKRFRDSRGLIPPMKVTLQNKSIYMFTKSLGKRGIGKNSMFRGENEAILAWFKNPLQE
jgi:hypothetical protein